MWSIANRKTEDLTIDTLNLVLGIALVLTPWLLGYVSMSTAAWNAWIVGSLVGLVALGALVRFAKWEEWALLTLALWAFLSPWLLGFSGVIEAMYVHVIFGVLVAVLAALELWMARNKPISTI